MTTAPNDQTTPRTALVTGASSSIGEAIARELAAAGLTVAVHGRNEQRTRAVAEDIERQGGHAVALTADLSQGPDIVRKLAAEARKQLGGHVDVLVNNAGVYPGGPTESLDDDTVDALLATNIRAPHVLVAALAPGMAERGSGHIVNIGSWMARVGVPFMALYPATKAAVEQLTRAWAAEYGHHGIRVVTVAPGATATPGNADSADVLAAMTQGTPAGVPVQPVDIARAVRWVVSDQAGFVTGGTIDVDGGIASTRLG